MYAIHFPMPRDLSGHHRPVSPSVCSRRDSDSLLKKPELRRISGTGSASVAPSAMKSSPSFDARMVKIAESPLVSEPVKHSNEDIIYLLFEPEPPHEDDSESVPAASNVIKGPLIPSEPMPAEASAASEASLGLPGIEGVGARRVRSHSSSTVVSAIQQNLVKGSMPGRISTGSNNWTSDWDVSVFVPESILLPNLGLPEASPMRLKGASPINLDKVREYVTQLITDAINSTDPITYHPVVGMSRDGACRPLSYPDRVMAIRYWMAAEWNWETAKHLYTGPEKAQALRDMRSLGKSIYAAAFDAILEDYDSLNEADLVVQMNAFFRSIFVLETGWMKDTNTYSSHIVLRKDFHFWTQKVAAEWNQSALAFSRLKLAQHVLAEQPTSAEYVFFKYQDALKRRILPPSRVFDDQFKSAWGSAVERKERILGKKAEIESRLIAEKAALSHDETSLGQFRTQMIDLALNPDHLELAASNALYEERLGDLDAHFKDFLIQKHRFLTNIPKTLFPETLTPDQYEDKVSALAGLDEGDQRTLLAEWGVTDPNVVLSALGDLDNALLEVRRSQTEALLYSNEPYYAGAINDAVQRQQSDKSSDESAASFAVLKDPETYHQSFVENFGDIFKTWKLSHDEEGGLDARFLYVSSKYANRMLEAILLCFEKRGEPCPPVLEDEIKRMLTCVAEFLQLRKEEDRPSEDRVRDAICVFSEANPAFKGQPQIKIATAWFARLREIYIASEVAIYGEKPAGICCCG